MNRKVIIHRGKTKDAMSPEQEAAAIKAIRQKLTSASSDLERLGSSATMTVTTSAARQAERLVDQARQILFNAE